MGIKDRCVFVDNKYYSDDKFDQTKYYEWVILYDWEGEPYSISFFSSKEKFISRLEKHFNSEFDSNNSWRSNQNCSLMRENVVFSLEAKCEWLVKLHDFCKNHEELEMVYRAERIMFKEVMNEIGLGCSA